MSDLKKVRAALGLLSSMIKGGESHSDTSEKAVKEAHAALDNMSGCANCETLQHIDKVREFLEMRVVYALRMRGFKHDASKLNPPEAEGFAECTRALKGLTYGSEEYKAQLEEMKPFLDHHYANNDHHPEHYEGGIEEMGYLAQIEMLCDWAAATERHDDGCLAKSLHINHARFEIPRHIQEKLIQLAWELFKDKMTAHEEQRCPCNKEK